MVRGVPTFDEQGFYVGPLPRQEGKAQLIGQQDGVFRTAAAAAWPPQFCEWVASSILTNYSGTMARRCVEDGGEDKEKDKEEEKEEEEVEDEIDPNFPPVMGGFGRARTCLWKGEEVPFHDGGCLLSPGRWPRGKRKYPGGEWIAFREKLRKRIVLELGGEDKLERECFAMARGEQGCKAVRNETILEAVREEMACFVGIKKEEVVQSSGQPFYLGLLSIEKAGDGDAEFLTEVEDGVPLGVLGELPRNPNAFEAQRKWPLEEDPEGRYLMERENYPSAREHEEHLREHLEAEVREGLVRKLTVKQFEEEYGSNRAVASLAVLVEDAVSGKKRVIHDATHGVGVNNRIKVRDKIRMPGPREKRHLLEELKENREVAFSLIGDFGKAHRRFKYDCKEHGFLGCRVSSEDPYIYVNLVGTFGVASTPYWWARIAGSLVRVAHCLVGPGPGLELLLYADDLEALGIGKPGRQACVLAYVFMAALGAPLKWGKQRGGLETEWIGLYTNYAEYSYGLSESRSAWLVQWMEGIVKAKQVTPREFSAGLGRMAFSSLALPWERPFLGPLYKWSCAVMDTKGEVLIPWAVAIILEWLVRRLREGGRLQHVVPRVVSSTSRATFWTDARATEEGAWIGGFLKVSEDLRQCPWFAMVEASWAPWIDFRAKNPKRVIAALELLGTIIAVKLWGETPGMEMEGCLEAFTDNRGNMFALRRGMSTKYPLTILLMELSETLRKLDCTLNLKWVKRDDNQDADDLSNLKFDNFDLGRRVEVKGEEIVWLVFGQMDKVSRELYEELQEEKNKAAGKKRKMHATSKGRKALKILPKW